MTRSRAATSSSPSPPKSEPEAAWYVYMVRCVDGSLYTGVATDLARRVREHNGEGSAGARYTRARRPVQLVYREVVASRAAAVRREMAIKRLPKSSKEALVAAAPVRR